MKKIINFAGLVFLLTASHLFAQEPGALNIEGSYRPIAFAEDSEWYNAETPGFFEEIEFKRAEVERKIGDLFAVTFVDNMDEKYSETIFILYSGEKDTPIGDDMFLRFQDDLLYLYRLEGNDSSFFVFSKR